MSDTDDADSRRNTYVEAAVTATLERIDAFAAGAELRPITARLLRNALVRLGRRGVAVRVGIYPARWRITKWELGRV